MAARLGAVPYLNVAPLIHGLSGDPLFTVIQEVPSRLARRLHAGDLDVASLPSIEYANGDYVVVPEIAIASRGPVASVNLFHRGDPRRARTVALDTSSRTSVALTRVLLAEWGADPSFVPAAPDVDAMLREADAAVVIGDPSLEYAGDAARIDLGQAWTELTGLPFVWALWVARPGTLEPAHVARLQRARDEGLLAIDAIAERYDGVWGKVADRQRAAARRARYLRENIVYALGEREQQGMMEFHRRAAALGIVPAVRELRLLDGATIRS